MIRTFITMAIVALPLLGGMSSQPLAAAETDAIVLGDPASERTHGFSGAESEIIRGLGGYSARVLLPKNPAEWQGGSIKFKLKVVPRVDNYLTVRFSGDDVSSDMLIMYINGKQLGYRHLGDYECLDLGSKEPYKPGRFYYRTTVLPRALTDAAGEIEVEIRQTGRIWGYGRNFEQYQKVTEGKSRGIYAMFSHTAPYYVESGIKLPALPALRQPEAEKIDFSEIRRRINKEVSKFMRPNELSPSQFRMEVLAHAYYLPGNAAYKKDIARQRLLESFDQYFIKHRKDSKLATHDRSTFNPEWFGFAHMGSAMLLHKDYVRPRLDENIKDENGKDIKRRDAYAEMFKIALDFLVTHRRQYTNQSMIIDKNIRVNNDVLKFVAPSKALPDELTLQFLKEAVGLLPWSGSLDKNGKSTWPQGKDFYLLSRKHLTRELGYVGSYGEVLDHVARIYEATIPAPGEAGDADIFNSLNETLKARAIFRYPARNAAHERIMRLESEVGWRDTYQPGQITYAQRMSRDGSCIQAAALLLSDEAVGYSKQMFEERHFMVQVKALEKAESGLRATFGLMTIPLEYEKLSKAKDSGIRLPMSPESPDFVFADEENGVVAIKDGANILYASLYWRARTSINFLSKIHFVSDEFEQTAVVRNRTLFTPEGHNATLRNHHNFGFANGGPRYPGNFDSLHAGTVQPIAKVPDGVKNFKPGHENIFAGKGDYYELAYKDYLMAMNAHKLKTFEFQLPSDGKYVALTDGKIYNGGSTIKLNPMTTVVLKLK